MKREFFYPSADGETKIHGVEWIPRKGAEMLGWELNELFEKTLLAMKSCEKDIQEEMAAIYGEEE